MRQSHIAASEPAARADETRVLYGDSTPFPYAIDFLDATRAVVECCVTMLASQATIDDALQRSVELEQRLKHERWQLDSLLMAVKKAASAFVAGVPARVATAAQQVLEGTRAIVDRERVALDGLMRGENAVTLRAIDDACAAALQSLETLLLHHVPPQSTLAWSLAAVEEGYDAHVRVTTRFGLDAQFDIAVPQSHLWSRLRRVGELAADTVVRLPRPLSKRGRGGDAQEVSLDKLVVTAAVVEPPRITMTLRRAPKAGAGYRLEVDSASEATIVQALDELGQPVGEVHELVDGERQPVVALASALLDSSFDLVLRRQLMTDSNLDHRTLSSRFEPRGVVQRLIYAYAPIVSEISKRSGSPRELMLRKELSGGRREAIFITRAELQGKIARLPPHLRALFDPLGL